MDKSFLTEYKELLLHRDQLIRDRLILFKNNGSNIFIDSKYLYSVAKIIRSRKDIDRNINYHSKYLKDHISVGDKVVINSEEWDIKEIGNQVVRLNINDTKEKLVSKEELIRTMGGI